MTPSAQIQHLKSALNSARRLSNNLSYCQLDMESGRPVVLKDQTLEMIQELEDALKGAREALG